MSLGSHSKWRNCTAYVWTSACALQHVLPWWNLEWNRPAIKLYGQKYFSATRDFKRLIIGSCRKNSTICRLLYVSCYNSKVLPRARWMTKMGKYFTGYECLKSSSKANIGLLTVIACRHVAVRFITWRRHAIDFINIVTQCTDCMTWMSVYEIMSVCPSVRVYD